MLAQKVSLLDIELKDLISKEIELNTCVAMKKAMVEEGQTYEQQLRNELECANLSALSLKAQTDQVNFIFKFQIHNSNIKP